MIPTRVGLFQPNRTRGAVGRWRGIPCRSKQSGCPTHQHPFARLRGVPGRFSRNFPTPEGAPFAAVGSALWGTNWEPRWTPPLRTNPPPGLQAAFAWCPEPRVSLMNPSEFDAPSKQGDTGSELVPKIRNTGPISAPRMGEQVEAVLQAIGQGDCYQVNLTRRVPIHHRSIGACRSRSSRDRATQDGAICLAWRSPNRFSQPGSFLVRRAITAHASHQGDASGNGDPDELPTA